MNNNLLYNYNIKNEYKYLFLFTTKMLNQLITPRPLDLNLFMKTRD